MMKIEKGRMYLVGEIVKRSTYRKKGILEESFFPTSGKQLKHKKLFTELSPRRDETSRVESAEDIFMCRV